MDLAIWHRPGGHSPHIRRKVELPGHVGSSRINHQFRQCRRVGMRFVQSADQFVETVLRLCGGLPRGEQFAPGAMNT